MLWLEVTYFIASCLLLILAGNFLVRSLTALSRFLRLSEFIVGFVLMSFSTSLPELSVAISSALIAQPAIVLGNVIGSNIVNLTLVAGVTAMLGRKLPAKDPLIKRDSYWMLFVSLLAVGLMYFGKSLSRIDGSILVIAFLIYMYLLFKDRHKYHHDKPVTNHVPPWHVLGYFVLLLASLGMLFFSAKYVVDSGQAISLTLGLPPIFIGLFFIALGTSLPELAFSTGAALKRHAGLSLGNLIGSVVFNSTIVLGIAAIISPITSNLVLFATSSFFMIIICFLFAIFIETNKGLDWKEGFVLLLFYIFFIMVEFSLKGYYLNGIA